MVYSYQAAYGATSLVDLVQSSIILRANPKRVVTLPFQVAISSRESAVSVMARINRVFDAVSAMSLQDRAAALSKLEADFGNRHKQLRAICLERYNQIREALGDKARLSEEEALLAGAYFSHEFSYQAAAILNPSVVRHPDQTNIPPDAIRFVLSTRCLGEGHLSTISFREGIFYADGSVELLPASDFSVAAHSLPAGVTEGPITAKRANGASLSETVLFPVTRAQANGLEDLRMVEFDNGGERRFLGTYTAFSGGEVRCELFETTDFETFRLQPMRGAATYHKALAFFPRRINGRYAAIGRLDHESLYYLESDDLKVWNNGERVLEPRLDWELMQVGNCGSPIELDEGWLVITHGVGPFRAYALSAVLLDKSDPRRVIARSKTPLLAPTPEGRDGYAPNVVYTCGAMRAGSWLFLPYAVADTSIRFASIKLSEILTFLGV